MKDAEREARQQQILRDFGHDPKNAIGEAMEQAEIIAERCYETMKKGRG